MAKNIVFCADGTWNGPGVNEDADGVPDLTNVLKLFLLLEGDDTWETIRLKDEQEKKFTRRGVPAQVAKYIHGVGDSRNPVHRLLGGGLGAGVVTRIVRGYTFISRHYQPGDRITLVGFSRGAYTARALGGMICREGLLDRDRFDLSDKELAYSLAITVWRAYRAGSAVAKGGPFAERVLLSLMDLPGFARRPLQAGETRQVDSVEAIAVWDTVGSLGVPVFDGNGDQMDRYQFADLDLSAKVKAGLHAVSVDEQRVHFPPTLWNARAGIEQRLFPGAHSDVGGGYPAAESGLSDIALLWMVEQLKKREVAFTAVPRGIVPDPLARAHEPWREGWFANFPARPRRFLSSSRLVQDASIQARRAGMSGYSPPKPV